MAWVAREAFGADPAVAYPIDDGREHDIGSEECWCGPQWMKRNGAGPILVHHSAKERRNSLADH